MLIHENFTYFGSCWIYKHINEYTSIGMNTLGCKDNYPTRIWAKKDKQHWWHKTYDWNYKGHAYISWSKLSNNQTPKKKKKKKRNELPTVGFNICSKSFLVPDINVYITKLTLGIKCMPKVLWIILDFELRRKWHSECGIYNIKDQSSNFKAWTWATKDKLTTID